MPLIIQSDSVFFQISNKHGQFFSDNSGHLPHSYKLIQASAMKYFLEEHSSTQNGRDCWKKCCKKRRRLLEGVLQKLLMRFETTE